MHRYGLFDQQQYQYFFPHKMWRNARVRLTDNKSVARYPTCRASACAVGRGASMAKRILRLGPAVYGPDGKIPLGRTAFRKRFIETGRLRLVPLGARAVGVVEEEIDAVVEELIAARDTAPPRVFPGAETMRSQARKPTSRRARASDQREAEVVGK